MRSFTRHWFRRETAGRAVKVALVVGPILTMINHYDLLLTAAITPKLVFKILLTFAVPYAVSSYSSARAYMEDDRRASARAAGDDGTASAAIDS
jgi:hypothetical protein